MADIDHKNHQDSIDVAALRDMMLRLNHCWPRWHVLAAANISIGDRQIAGPLPDPWQRVGSDVRAVVANQQSLAWLNPQPLPPLPVDASIAVAVEVADRLIAYATLANEIAAWLPASTSQVAEHIAKRLVADADELDQLGRPKFTVRIPKGGWPDPDPEPRPEEIELTPQARLAFGTRFDAAARTATTPELRAVFGKIGDRSIQGALANL